MVTRLQRATRHLSIRGRMLLGFAVVIGLVGFGNLYGVRSVSRVATEAVFARDIAFRKVLVLLEVENLVQRMANSVSTAVDVGIPEAFVQAGALRRELDARLEAGRAEFPDDRGLARDVEDLRRRVDGHFRQGEDLLALALGRDWDAFGPPRKAFQESQTEILQHVAEVKGRCVRDLDGSLLAIARRTRRTASSVTAATVAALGAALLVAFYLSGEIVRPLQGLIARMRQARSGDFSVRADVVSRDETGVLSQGFNEMLQHLEGRDEELRLHRSHLEELVDERTAQLEVVNERLQTELAFRQLTEAAQAESEERLWRVLNSVRAGILIVDAARREVVDVNAFALELLGARRQDVVGRRCESFLCAGDGEASPLLSQGEAAENVEGTLRRADGWFLPILESVVPVSHKGEDHLIASFVDISEVKRQEKALRESEQRYRTLFASAEDAIFVLDPRPGSPVRIVDLNPAAARMHGYESEELKGRCLGDVDRGRLLAEGRGEAILRGEWVSAELVHRRRDGGEFPVQVSAGPLDYGEARYVLAFARDVTEQKRAREELEAFNERLRRSNQDLEDFAYVASHDLQEPLRKVQAFGDRLKARWGECLGDQGRDYLERMQNASGRMQRLIEDLLTFSRVTTKARPSEVVDLERVAREVLSDLEVRIEQTGARVELGPLPPVEADPLQMRQLLQNLVGNALKFHRPGEPPLVRIWGEAAPADGEGDGPRGSTVRLFVEDSGIGFDPKHADRIFGVFQRLHGRGEYEGTGVGLAVCRKIAERHRGSILAEGWPGRGARFVTTLPAPNLGA